MPKYIDAEALYRRIKAETNPYGKPTIEYESGVKCLDVIDAAPTADVAPVRRGEWIAEQKSAEYCEFRCSICDYSIGETDQFDETEVKQFSEWYKYCPCCGAMMEGMS